VTTYLVDVHHLTHTCPANPEPHPYDTRRTIVAVFARQPCQRPVTVRSGSTTTVIDCGRHETPDRQCDACRNTIVKRHTTATHTGHVTDRTQQGVAA
jgi:hypothetical protein